MEGSVLLFDNKSLTISALFISIALNNAVLLIHFFLISFKHMIIKFHLNI